MQCSKHFVGSESCSFISGSGLLGFVHRYQTAHYMRFNLPASNMNTASEGEIPLAVPEHEAPVRSKP